MMMGTPKTRRLEPQVEYVRTASFISRSGAPWHVSKSFQSRFKEYDVLSDGRYAPLDPIREGAILRWPTACHLAFLKE